MKYNHAFTIAFSVETEHEADDVTAEELRDAIRKRIDDCMNGTDADLIECCGAPFDTYEVDDD